MPNEEGEPPPEGPEVKRITEQLHQEFAGHTLNGLAILSGRYTKKLPNDLPNYSPRMPMKIESINCKGKFIYFLTDTSWSIWNTLGLTGRWAREREDYARVVFQFDNGAAYFVDMRNFGTLTFVEGKKALDKKLSSLGPDMLAEDLSDKTFRWLLKKNGTKSLPEFLMNQRNISGVGNYIKAEALYLAKLSPHRLCYTLTDTEIHTLNEAIKAIIRASYETGGSTFRTYADFNGEVGMFSGRFMIYRQAKDPQGNTVVKQNTKDKRTTHWVPAVQK